MKKIFTLIAFTSVVAILNAQNFTQVWRKTAQSGASDFPWFTSTTNLVRTMTYNPVTDKVYVALSNAAIGQADTVYILDANTGNRVGTLSKSGTGMGTEAFKHLRIRVANDGAIYSSSLSVTAGSFQRSKIYRWASEADTATVSSIVTGERCGDVMSVVGTGVNTKIYLAGNSYAFDYSSPAVRDSTAQKIYVCTTVDGITFTKTDSIRFIAPLVSGRINWFKSLEAVSENILDGFWAKNFNHQAYKINVSGTPGAYVGSIGLSITAGNGNGEVSTAYGNVRYLVTPGNKKYLGFAGAFFTGIPATANTGVVMKMIDVTDEANLKTVGTDTLRGVNNTDTLLRNTTNTLGNGDVAYKFNGDGSYNVFYLITHNGVACTRSATTLPVELSKFTTQLVKNNVKLNWNTANEVNNVGFEIEKSINGEKFSKIGFINPKSNTQNSYEFIDENATNTKASTIYYRLKQIDKDGKFSFSNVELVKLPNSKAFSISTFENPFKNDIKLLIGAEKETPLTISLTNTKGQVVKTIKYTVQKGNTNVVLPALELSKGQYFVTITDGSSKQTISILKN